MNDEVFFDTNILIYAVNSVDPRGAIAREWLRRGGTISVQILNEFASVLRRKQQWAWADIAAATAAFRRLCAAPLAIETATHDQAIDIAARAGLNIFDSLVIASALQARCTTLLSEDMQHGRVIDGRLTIHNPFAH